MHEDFSQSPNEEDDQWMAAIGPLLTEMDISQEKRDQLVKRVQALGLDSSEVIEYFQLLSDLTDLHLTDAAERKITDRISQITNGYRSYSSQLGEAMAVLFMEKFASIKQQKAAIERENQEAMRLQLQFEAIKDEGIPRILKALGRDDLARALPMSLEKELEIALQPLVFEAPDVSPQLFWRDSARFNQAKEICLRVLKKMGFQK